MKVKDVHVLNWDKITQYPYCNKSNKIDNGVETKINKGILFEDLIETLLIAMFPNEVWRRTGKSHDGKKDFVYPYDEHLQAQKWAECKNYNSNLSLNIIAPTLIMGTIENIQSIFFFSYSPLNDNAIEGLLRYSETTKKNIKIFDGNVLESLICKYHNINNVSNFFPNTDFEKAYEIIKGKRHRIIKIIKDINGNKISPQHLFELGESFYIETIIQNFTHKLTNYKIFTDNNEAKFLKCDMPIQYYSLPFANIGEYSVLCQSLKPGNIEYTLKITTLSEKKTSVVKSKIKIIDEPYLFWTGANALCTLDQCSKYLMNYHNIPLLIAAGSGMGKSTLINILLQDLLIQSKYTILKINLNLTRNCCVRSLLSLLIGLHEENDLPIDQIEDDNKALTFLIGNYAESAEKISEIIMHFYNQARPYLFVIDDIQKIDRAYITLFRELDFKSKNENKPIYFIFALNEEKCTMDKLFYRLNWETHAQECNIVKLEKFEKDDILAFLKHKFGLVDINKYFTNFNRKIRPLEMHNFCTNIKRCRIISPVPNSRFYHIIDPFKFEDCVKYIHYADIQLKDICISMNQGDIPEYILKYLYITDRINTRMRKAYSKTINKFITLSVLKEKDGVIEFYHDEVRKYVGNNFVFLEEDYADVYYDSETDAISKSYCAINQLGHLRGSISFLRNFFYLNYEIKKKKQRFDICWLIFENLNLLTQVLLTGDALYFVKKNYALLNSEQGHSTFYEFLKHIADTALIYKWDTDEVSIESMAYFIKKFFDRSLSTYNHQQCLSYFIKYEKIFCDLKNISESKRFFWLSHYANRVAIALDRTTIPLSVEPEEVSSMYALSEKYCKDANLDFELLMQIAVDDFNRHYIYRHNLTVNIVSNMHENLLDIKQKISKEYMLLDYHLLLLEYLELSLLGKKTDKSDYAALRKKVLLARKNCSSAFYIYKLYMLEIYIFMDLEDYSEATKILSEAFEFSYKKEMRSYIYKLTYIKAHLLFFQENLVYTPKFYCLIELAFEQLVNQRSESINDLKREIFLLVRLVCLIKISEPDRIALLTRTLNIETKTLIKKICVSMDEEKKLFNMQSYFVFKNISFPNI